MSGKFGSSSSLFLLRTALDQFLSSLSTALLLPRNAGNCDLYVLKKDLEKPGFSPFVLDRERGDVPRSSIDVMVKLKSTGEQQILKLENYLSIPPPRTTHGRLIKHLLAEQHRSKIPKGAQDIASVVFMPFVDRTGCIKGRSTSGVASTRRSFSSSVNSSCDASVEMDTRLSNSVASTSSGTRRSEKNPGVVARKESNVTNNSSTIEEEEDEEEEVKDAVNNLKQDGHILSHEEVDDYAADVDDDDCHSESSSSSYHGDMPIRLARQEESRRWAYFQIPGLTDQKH